MGTTGLAGSPKSKGLTDHALLIHCLARIFLTIRHICIRIYVCVCVCVCIYIYIAGRRLSSLKLSCILFGIIVLVDSTNGVYMPFSVAILINYLFFQVCVLPELPGDGAM